MRKSQNSEIFYKRLGDKNLPTVVLLHGFLGSSQIWETLLPYFQKDYQLICIDLPGHGQSECHHDVTTMQFCAEQIMEILTKEKILEAHFVGHSMGGYVSLEMLDLFPNVIKSISLLNSTAKEDNEQKKKDRLLAVKVFDRSPKVFVESAIENLFYAENLALFPEEVKRMQDIALATPIAGAQASLRGMRLRKDFVNLVRTSKVPIQIIAGEYDNTVRYETILEQVKDSNIKLVTLSSGHMGFVESFEECKNALLTFIAEHK